MQLRYRSAPVAVAASSGAATSSRSTSRAPFSGLAPGQAAVFYRDDVVVGGGRVAAALRGPGRRVAFGPVRRVAAARAAPAGAIIRAMTGQETGSTTAAAAPGSTRPRVSRRILALVVLVVALSAVVRLVDLGRYPDTVFDEHYYVHDAAVMLRGDLAGSAAEPWKPAAAALGRSPRPAPSSLIAAGISGPRRRRLGLAGARPLCGVALIALVFPLARRLGLSDEWALAALVLAAADPMLMLDSRLAVLDVFVALATAARRLPGAAVRRSPASASGGWWRAAPPSARRWPASGRACSPCRRRCSSWCRRWSGTGAAGSGRCRRSRRSSSPRWRCTCWRRCRTSPPVTGSATGCGCRSTWRRSAGASQGDRSFASRPVTWPFDAYPIWYKWSVGVGRHERSARHRQLPALVGRDRRVDGARPAGDPAPRLAARPGAGAGRRAVSAVAADVAADVHLLHGAGDPVRGRPGGDGAVAAGGRRLGARARAPRSASPARRRRAPSPPPRRLGLLSRLRRGRRARTCRSSSGFPVPFDYYAFLTPFTTWK